MHHLLTYQTSSAAAVVIGTSMGMVADGAFAQGNTGYRFVERYKMLAAYNHGASLTQVEFRSPTINALGLWNTWPLNLSLNQPSNYQVDDMRSYAPIIPQMEDFEAHAADSAVGGEKFDVACFIGTENHRTDEMHVNQLLDAMTNKGEAYAGRRITVNSTTTLNKGAQGWGADVALTFEQLPRGGVYAVIGGQAVAAACMAFRINFPRHPLYKSSRKLFPGDLVNQAVGDIPNRLGRNWLGVWGVFHTWELPFASLYGQAAGAVAWNGNLDLVYLGGNDNYGSVFNNALTVLGNAA